MDNHLSTPFSGSILKLIAVISMLVDHVAAYLLVHVPACTAPLFTFFGEPASTVFLMRFIGRMAFPIFCFLLVEGFLHTRNRARYALYLLLFAVISEIPFDLAQSGGWNPHEQNVFFTLLLGYLGMYIPPLWGKDRFNRFLCILMISIASLCVQSDYGLPGFLFIMCMYWFRKGAMAKMIAGTVLLPNPMGVALATAPIVLYNGERGFIRGGWLKYAFYAFYPAHLLVIHLLRILLI